MISMFETDPAVIRDALMKNGHINNLINAVIALSSIVDRQQAQINGTANTASCESQIENTVLYDLWKDEKGVQCVAIFGLYVHPKMRRHGIGKLLMETVLTEIKSKYPGLPIKIEAEPFGAGDKLSKKQLIRFYSKYNLKFIDRGSAH